MDFRLSSTLVQCRRGVFDCDSSELPSNAGECANYNEHYHNMEGQLWIVILSGLTMCAMAFGMGANDAGFIHASSPQSHPPSLLFSANAWGTSVGSGAISLRSAVLIGAIMEFIGAVTLGHGVSDTIQKGVSDLDSQSCWACGYCDSAISLYQIGMFGALISTAFFLLLSSFSSMPVSATHAVVGGVVGMTWASVGVGCLNWSYDGLGGIFASWIISPLFSGIVGALTFLVTQRFIFLSPAPRQRAFIALPSFITLVTFVISYLICLKSPMAHSHADEWVFLAASSTISLLALVISLTLILPWVKRNMPSALPKPSFPSIATEEHSKPPNTTPDTASSSLEDMLLPPQHTPSHPPSLTDLEDMEVRDAMFCFRVLLLCNASLESFAHGANDTANCTAPFQAVYQIYLQGVDSCGEPDSGVWIMALAGSFVALGVITFGQHVIETIGKNLTLIDYQRGFCIEFSSCVTVVLATMMGLPVSTTHCQIGSVVFVGLVSMGAKSVAWELVGKIFATWMITLPFSGAISIAVMESLRPVIR
jgi:solute carrier family 20 (sodium-dependent phosphate transporter)